MTKRFGEESRLWISFSVSNFKGNPDEVTKVLKWKPSRILTKGEPFPNMQKRIEAGFNQWSVAVHSDSFDLEKQIATLARRLRNLKRLDTKIGKYQAWVTVVLEIVGDDTRPSLVVSPKYIQALAKLGVGLSVDYYFFKKALRSKR